jgi:hypothetical protein
LGRWWQLDELIGVFLFTAINRFARPTKLANFFVSLCPDRAGYTQTVRKPEKNRLMTVAAVAD